MMKNKSNSMKIIEQKKVLLKTFENESQNILDEKLNKKQINKLSKDNKELHYNYENKENICIQNSNINKNRLDDFNFYLIQKNKDKLKTYEKIDNLDYYKNKQENKNIVYSKDIHNNNSNNSKGHISLNIQKSDDNKNNDGVKKYIKKLNNKVNTYNNNEGFLTERFQSKINNQQFTIKNKENNSFDNKPLTERECKKDNIINKDTDFNNDYLLPKIKPGKKTLILDLDETLIHSSFKPFNIHEDFKIKFNSSKINNKSENNKNQYIIYVLKRPYVGIFLSIVCDIFEVVVFTASILGYANPIIEQIDIEKKIKYRLFREHCIKVDKDKYIKNLYRLGRDLKNIIIIDNNPFSYALNVENGLPISTWETNQADNELIRLIPLLQYLSKNSISDVRPIIKRIVKNNKINYDETNKIINDKNKSYIYSYFSKEKEKNNNDEDNNKKTSYKEIFQKIDEKIQNENNKNTFKKQEYSDSEIYHLNNSISNNQKILKNMSVNKEHQMFIKKLRNINNLSHRGKSENLKPKKIELFLEKEEKNNDLNDKETKLNLSERNLNNNKSDYFKKYINFNDIIKKSKTKDNKTYIESKKKDISIPLPINYTQFIPINKNNIIKKKIYSKKPSRIYLNRNNSKKLIKNNSDFISNINNNITKEQNLNIKGKFNYPSLKNILYHKLFYNKFYNKKEINNVSLHSKSISRNKKNDIITDNKDPKKSSFNFKGNDINFKETNKTYNYSFEYYLKNKFNLSVLDNNMNNFISRLKINNQKNIINEPKKNLFKY